MARPDAFALAGLAVLASASAAGAASWREEVEAPETFPAQETLGSGALDTILGDFAGGFDVDLFLIRITEPEAFSALVEGILDPQVFLFDVEGFGIATNDDNFTTVGFNALLPVGNPLYASRPPDLYALAVSNFNLDPFSAGGAIFPDVSNVVGPTGPGGSSPLTNWVSLNTIGSGLGLDHYTVALTGSTFAPEPSASILGGAALLAALALARRAERALRRRSHAGGWTERRRRNG